MRIVIDAFGGDKAPGAIVKGAALARKELGVEVVLTGSEDLIRETAAGSDVSLEGIEIVHAPLVMDMHDEAKLVLSDKKDSSMGRGLRLLADGQGDAFVTAGPTGAALMGATMIVRRLKGVKRPALAPVMPGLKRPFMLIDCGANVECRPEMLDQFAVFGTVYMRHMFGIESPLVGLANNGAEDSKGTQLQIDAYKLLSENPRIRFGGNAEGRDIPLGEFDVVVTDGFTGNLILKVTEGLGLSMISQLKTMFTKNLSTKLAAVAMKPALREFRDKNDHEKVGGAPFIGVRKPVIKAHGSSGETALLNAVRQAVRWAGSGVSEEIERELAASQSKDGKTESE